MLRLCFQDGFLGLEFHQFLLQILEHSSPPPCGKNCACSLESFKTTLFHPQSSGMVERFYLSLKSSLHSKLAGSVWIHHLPHGSLGFALCSEGWSSLFHCRSCLWFPFGAPWNVSRCSGVGDILGSFPSCRVSHPLLITLLMRQLLLYLHPQKLQPMCLFVRIQLLLLSNLCIEVCTKFYKKDDKYFTPTRGHPQRAPLDCSPPNASLPRVRFSSPSRPLFQVLQFFEEILLERPDNHLQAQLYLLGDLIDNAWGDLCGGASYNLHIL